MTRNKNSAGDEIFTPEEVDAAIEEVVAEAGEGYIYDGWKEQCLYGVRTVEGTIPSCLVGRVVHRLDHEGFYLLRESSTFSSQPDTIVTRFTDDCVWALQQAQWAQDHGWTWGNALRVYNKVRYEDSEFSPYWITEAELD